MATLALKFHLYSHPTYNPPLPPVSLRNWQCLTKFTLIQHVAHRRGQIHLKWEKINLLLIKSRFSCANTCPWKSLHSYALL